ncbi:hypothetical protein BDN71DRAFT_1431656 [Pleurotus eryngii]|uniref:Uncharacterized protein n=1 Tax=Pleurotus eryngii TaxID=5323 RepID=A0A9P5ZU77_PLEER|nr:hypothetical protein BDN71DRAFT_1431656 [Pleurotus eryngii]
MYTAAHVLTFMLDVNTWLVLLTSGHHGIMALPKGHPLKVIHIVNTILQLVIVILGKGPSLISMMNFARGVPLSKDQQYPMLALKGDLPQKLVVYLLNYALDLWPKVETHLNQGTLFKKLILGSGLKKDKISDSLFMDDALALYNLAHVLSWHMLLKEALYIQPGALLSGFPPGALFLAAPIPPMHHTVQLLDPIILPSSSSNPPASTSLNPQGTPGNNMPATSSQLSQQSIEPASSTQSAPPAPPSPSPAPASQEPIFPPAFCNASTSNHSPSTYSDTS